MVFTVTLTIEPALAQRVAPASRHGASDWSMGTAEVRAARPRPARALMMVEKRMVLAGDEGAGG